MSLVDALQVSRELASRIGLVAQGIEFPAFDRVRLSAALLDQVHEHHQAIQLLLEKELVGSAFALVRSTFEATVRGSWIFRCATDVEIEKFKKDTLSLNFSELIEAVEGCFETHGSALSEIRAKYWSGMCSYAHGGYQQAVRRISATDIGPEYSEEAQLGVLSFADFCVVLASIELCSLGGHDDLADQIAKLLPDLQ